MVSCATSAHLSLKQLEISLTEEYGHYVEIENLVPMNEMAFARRSLIALLEVESDFWDRYDALRKRAGDRYAQKFLNQLVSFYGTSIVIYTRRATESIGADLGFLGVSRPSNLVDLVLGNPPSHAGIMRLRSSGAMGF